MKQTDFDRLKAVCEKEGFEVLNLTHDDNEKFFVVTKPKDIWEGVEFFKFKEKVFKVKELYQLLIKNINGFNYEKKHCEPSTEQAYIEQLKAEAFKRFGNINEGDGFINTHGKKVKVDIFYFGRFNYDKLQDILDFGGCYLFEKGKWATRVKERVKVEPNIRSMNDFASKLPENQKQELKEIIALKLEEYLNKESE